MIVLSTGPIEIHKTLTIVGPGADLLAIDGDRKFNVVLIHPGADVTIERVTFRNGFNDDDDFFGPGGIGNFGKTWPIVWDWMMAS